MPIAAHAATNGALTPSPPISTPPSAEPADTACHQRGRDPGERLGLGTGSAHPDRPADHRVLAREHRRDRDPGNRLAAMPSGIVRARISGATLTTAAISSHR